MSSQQKVAANRRNAQKSTGPRTLSGKAIACMNALKHGLCARKPLIPGEDEAAFQQFTAGWAPRPADPRRAADPADALGQRAARAGPSVCHGQRGLCAVRQD